MREMPCGDNEGVVGQPRLKRIETQAGEITKAGRWGYGIREGSLPEAELGYCNLEVRLPGGACRSEGVGKLGQGGPQKLEKTGGCMS